MREKFNIKDLWYGFLHVMVALSAILFVCGTTGINLPLSFLTIGIGTLVFHLFTKNKLAVLMGVSGSFIGGMAIVGAEYGASYVAGGVVMCGIIYLIAGLVIRKFPGLYDKFPKYILNSAVFLIALNLMPIGASMITANVFIAGFTVLVGFILYSKDKTAAWAFPGALLAGTILSMATYAMPEAGMDASQLAFVFPTFNLAAFSLIGVVAFAVVFESLGDSKNCANAQGIELEGKDFGNVLLGNGAASTISGCLGGLPLTTYSENVGFIYLTGYKRPTAQIVSSLIFILMAFVPGISNILTFIPSFVYGAMLLFLFALIGANSIKNMNLQNENQVKVLIAMLSAFFITPADVFSPIASAILVGLVAHYLVNKYNKN